MAAWGAGVPSRGTLSEMPTTIDQYREAKNQYLKLRNQAKKELVARFHELSAELVKIQRELLEDFGEKVVISNKPKKVRSKTATAAEPEAVPEKAPSKASAAKVVAMEKSIERQKKKLSDTQAAGKPTKAAQDRLYELEDELRFLKG